MQRSNYKVRVLLYVGGDKYLLLEGESEEWELH
jgi:hypothetical protein